MTYDETFTVQDAERVARAFWRRIYDYRNDYGKELPDDCPVEFVAHMATALAALRLGIAGYTNGAQMEYVSEDGEAMFYADTEHDCKIKLLAKFG